MEVLPDNEIPRSPYGPIIEVTSSLFYIPHSLPSFMSLFSHWEQSPNTSVKFTGCFEFSFF